MLLVISKARDLDICELKSVYVGSFNSDLPSLHNEFSDNARYLREQEKFYQNAYNFLKGPNAFYGVWLDENHYVSAVRVDKYSDGVILTGLETTPQQRGRGYAKLLVCAVSKYLAQQGVKKIYSHVSKNNDASLAVHRACGFYPVKYGAAFIDGSASSKYITLCRIN